MKLILSLFWFVAFASETASAAQQKYVSITSQADDAWCTSNCNHVPRNCPSSWCKLDTGEPKVIYYSVYPFANPQSNTAWCNSNCPNNSNSVCPRTYCVIEGQPNPNEPIYSTSLTADDEWCYNNCYHTTPYCPDFCHSGTRPTPTLYPTPPPTSPPTPPPTSPPTPPPTAPPTPPPTSPPTPPPTAPPTPPPTSPPTPPPTAPPTPPPTSPRTPPPTAPPTPPPTSPPTTPVPSTEPSSAPSVRSGMPSMLPSVAPTNGPTAKPAGSNGDPHFKSWIGEHFEFHGQCDLVLAKDSQFADGIGMDVQIRTKLVRHWSYIKSAAIRIGDDILEVQGSSEFEETGALHYWFNLQYQGKMTTLGGFPVKVHIDEGPRRKHVFEIDLSSKYPGQKIVIDTMKEFVKVNFANASAEAFGNTVGMLGHFKTGMTYARDNKTVLNDFNELGNEWQVLPADDMFFHDVSYPQFPQRCILPEDPRGEQRRRLGEGKISVEEAEAACAKSLIDQLDIKDCVYDILATQDLDMVGAF